MAENAAQAAVITLQHLRSRAFDDKMRRSEDDMERVSGCESDHCLCQKNSLMDMHACVRRKLKTLVMDYG